MPIERLNDIDLYYETHGEGDPVLLIHGLGSDTGTWAHSFDQLKEYFRIILMENRGSGRSAKPEGEYTTELMAQDALALLDYLQIERSHVIGKSMGGMIAQILAARNPNRVKSLVLACTVMRHDAYGEELLALGRTIAEKAGLFETFRQAFLMSYSREYCMKNRDRLVEAEKLLLKVGNESLLRGYLSQSWACQKHDSRDIVAAITSPTLVIAGKRDVITPPELSQEMASKIPNAELILFRQGGHGFWREYPQDVNPVVFEFLEGHSG